GVWLLDVGEPVGCGFEAGGAAQPSASQVLVDTAPRWFLIRSQSNTPGLTWRAPEIVANEIICIPAPRCNSFATRGGTGARSLQPRPIRRAQRASRLAHASTCDGSTVRAVNRASGSAAAWRQPSA